MRWRAMTSSDAPAVKAVADRVHPAYPEDAAIFAERAALYPAGCFALVAPNDFLLGYFVSHPWRSGRPPKLNNPIGAIPARADSYYIHDLALLPEARGAGAALQIVDRLAAWAEAEDFATLSLVAVNGSAGFWRRNRFEAVDTPGLAKKLGCYGADASFMVRRLRP